MINLDCHIDSIWNQFRGMPLGKSQNISGKDLLRKEDPPRMGKTFWEQSTYKDPKRKLAWIPFLSPVRVSVLLLRLPFIDGLRTHLLQPATVD